MRSIPARNVATGCCWRGDGSDEQGQAEGGRARLGARAPPGRNAGALTISPGGPVVGAPLCQFTATIRSLRRVRYPRMPTTPSRSPLSGPRSSCGHHSMRPGIATSIPSSGTSSGISAPRSASRPAPGKIDDAPERRGPGHVRLADIVASRRQPRRNEPFHGPCPSRLVERGVGIGLRVDVRTGAAPRSDRPGSGAGGSRELPPRQHVLDRLRFPFCTSA